MIIKNIDVDSEESPHKIIIQLQIGLEIALFPKLKNCKCISLIKISV